MPCYVFTNLLHLVHGVFDADNVFCWCRGDSNEDCAAVPIGQRSRVPDNRAQAAATLRWTFVEGLDDGFTFGAGRPNEVLRVVRWPVGTDAIEVV
jgi:hypothetical protein